MTTAATGTDAVGGDEAGAWDRPSGAGLPGVGPGILGLKGLTKRFGGFTAVDDVTLEIVDGEFFTIVGPSGSGKSTLVRMLAGLESVSDGDILLRGTRINRVPANRRPTAMVFQSLALFNHKTVGANIEFALKMRGVAPRSRRQRAEALLDLVRLPRAYYGRSVTTCSGGERQRIALARALASDPDILFFDEPLSAIDYRLRKQLEVEMKDLHRETGKTFIYITHSLEEAMVMSDRIAIMRDGRIIQVGPPQTIYRRPVNRFVAEFMGEVNLFAVTSDGDGRTIRVGGQERRLTLPPETGVGRPPAGHLVVRPEHLRVLGGDEPADCSFSAEIYNDYVLGSRVQFHARTGETTLIGEIVSDGRVRVAPGDTVRLGFDIADAAFVAE